MVFVNELFPLYLRIRKKWPRCLLFLFFYGSIFLGKLSIIRDERAVEHAWILKELGRLKKKNRVLDVGCVDSLLSHALVVRGLEAYGIDVRPYAEARPELRFVRRDIIDSGFPSSFFDCVVANSVLEHIGLSSPDYHDAAYEGGDFLAMKEIRRILRGGGLLILTLPLGSKFRVALHGGVKLRVYDKERLSELTSSFTALRADIFWRPRMRWRKTKHPPIEAENARETDLIICMTLHADGQGPVRFGDYLAAGRPVVTQQIGEISEAIASSDCGALARRADRKDLADKVVSTSSDRDGFYQRSLGPVSSTTGSGEKCT